jgi:hypothetical protein
MFSVFDFPMGLLAMRETSSKTCRLGYVSLVRRSNWQNAMIIIQNVYMQDVCIVVRCTGDVSQRRHVKTATKDEGDEPPFKVKPLGTLANFLT